MPRYSYLWFMWVTRTSVSEPLPPRAKHPVLVRTGDPLPARLSSQSHGSRHGHAALPPGCLHCTPGREEGLPGSVSWVILCGSWEPDRRNPTPRKGHLAALQNEAALPGNTPRLPPKVANSF